MLRKKQVGVISVECSNNVGMNEAGWWWERMMKVGWNGETLQKRAL